MKQIDYPMDPTIAAAELIEQRKLLKEINIQLNKLSEEKLSVLRRIALSTKKSGTISKVKEKKKQTVGRNNSKKNNNLVNKVIAPNISPPNPPVSVPLPPTTASLYNNNNNSTVAPPSTSPFITQLLPFAQQLPISAQQNLIYQHPSSSPLSSPSTIKNSTPSTKYSFSNSNIQDPVMPNSYTPPSSNHSSFIDTQGSMKSTSPTPPTTNHSFLNSNTQNTTASNGSTIAATNLINHTPTFSTEHFSSIQYSNNHRLPEIPVTHKELCTDTNSNDRIKHFPKNKGKSLPSTPLLSSQSMHTISDEPTIHSTYNPRKTVPVSTRLIITSIAKLFTSNKK
ncbi:hypothetical protein BJ944DRAFT_63099 [Cunninghamella echinulata]|nr:hypothetical protein BJ944DRAFT_63099 [Cunninghamella echinulata]